MSKVTSILDHPDHPANNLTSVVSRMRDKQAQRNQEILDFLDRVHIAKPKQVDEFPDHLWED
jgi:hypothetical protein